VFDRSYDSKVRIAAFDWLTDLVMRYGDVLSREPLARGFFFDDKRVPLVGPQGIFKPRILEFPLSITTAPEGPYHDSIGPDNLLRYRYRGIDPNHRDNRGLRGAMSRQLPLAYFYGVAPSRYVAAWPAFIVGDNFDPIAPTFSVAVDDKSHLYVNSEDHNYQGSVGEEAGTTRREYITSAVRIRLHQRAFRERVLEAYRRQCAFCRLRHVELLDAAHIIPDSDPEGEPVVTNGISLCNLHHAAFDRFFLGLRPDYRIEVRPDILREGDGPTLRHAIQGLQGMTILLPRKLEHRPDPALLAKRYELYLAAAK